MSIVLADSCVWIEALKDDLSEEAIQLEHLIDTSRVVITGLIITEVLQGIRDAGIFREVSEKLTALPSIELHKNAYITAAKLSIELRAKGLAIPLSDLLIASLCKEHDVQIYTLDRHFESIPGIKQWNPRKN
jgi:predicted nucleic acid-binding protein